MMPDHRDTVLIEQAEFQRARLGSALLYGRIDSDAPSTTIRADSCPRSSSPPSCAPPALASRSSCRSCQIAGDAYRATGASPAATRAHTGFHVDPAGNPNLGSPVDAADRGLYAVVFTPVPSNPPVKPTSSDAAGWPHYLDSPDPAAGHTALLTGDGPSAGYLTNPHIRELVIGGGDLIGRGSFIVRIEDGVWTVHRVF